MSYEPTDADLRRILTETKVVACVGVSIGLKAVFGAFDPTWVAKLVASLFLGIAIMIYWMAEALLTYQDLTHLEQSAPWGARSLFSVVTPSPTTSP